MKWERDEEMKGAGRGRKKDAKRINMYHAYVATIYNRCMHYVQTCSNKQRKFGLCAILRSHGQVSP